MDFNCTVGDFNFDLLKIQTLLNIFLIYFVVMVFYHILQPTRVTENTDTVADNIFSHNIQDDIISGNIL